MKKNHGRRALWLGNAALCAGALLLGAALSLSLPKPAFSAEEKRELTPWPSWSAGSFWAGDYARQLQKHYADTFPGREPLVRLAALVKEGYGLRPDEAKLMETPPSPAPPAEPTPALPGTDPKTAEGPTASSTVSPPEPEATGEKVGGLFLYKNRAYQLFGGLDSAGSRYAAVINRYHDALGDEVKIYNLIVPSSIQMADLPARYQNLSQPEHPKILNIYSQLDPAVTGVDVFDRLYERRGEYLYFGTDHHWTALGSYYAYTRFCEEAGLTPVDISTLEKRTLSDFRGTLYAQTQDRGLYEHPDHVDYYMMPAELHAYRYAKGSPFYGMELPLYGEYAKSPNSYSVFLHGDFPLTRIDTGIKNGRRIAVVKESYGNAFVPWLVNHYEQVYVVDLRYFELGLVDFIRENGINELLFINNVFAAHTDYHINHIAGLMYQQFVPPAPEPAPEPEPVPEPEPEAVPEPSQAQPAPSQPPAGEGYFWRDREDDDD